VVDFKLTYETLKWPVFEGHDGARVYFEGVVRPMNKGKEVLRLEFEAYEPMAISELRIIANEIINTWPDVNHIYLHHRLGIVPAGELAVVAAIASPHRAEAFAACEYLMNRLKESVPIWKKECYSDGYYWVSSTP
jgi:molybdopterin synthase catalytic subunit